MSKGAKMEITHTGTATGSASAASDMRGWNNVTPEKREQVAGSASDRKEQGGHNVPPAKPSKPASSAA